MHIEGLLPVQKGPLLVPVLSPSLDVMKLIRTRSSGSTVVKRRFPVLL